MTRQLILVLGLVLALAHADVWAEDLTRKELLTAKRLYDSKCAKCHRPYDPRDYSDEEWGLWMTRMSKKARLKPGQAKVLNRYLEGYRAEKPTVKTGNQAAAGAESNPAQPSTAKNP